ncbi:hypothetical protein FXW78_01010 [Rhodococcus opacus]|nr:hypothetical protein [Rhodococcus opacus]
MNRLAAAPLTVDLPSGRVVIDGYTLANLVIQMSLAAGRSPDCPRSSTPSPAARVTPPPPALAGTITPPGLIGYGLSYGVFLAPRTPRSPTASRSGPTRKPRCRSSRTPCCRWCRRRPRIFDDCDVWDVPAADAGVHDITTSDVPTLLRTGSLDAVTPPSRARAAAETLSRSDVLVFPGLGHDVLQSSQCAPAVTVGFLENPGGDVDTSCLDQVRVPTFTTP